MATQVSTASVFLALCTGALTCACLATAVAHGLLRMFMQARGVTPWTLRDTLGSGVLLLLGAICTGLAIVLAAFAVSDLPDTDGFSLMALVLALAAIGFVRFGLLSLRKLT